MEIREPGRGATAPARRYGLLLLLLCVSLVVGLVLSEVSHRVLRRFVCVGMVGPPFWRKDPRYGWGHRPNGEGWSFGCVGRRYEWRTYNRMNSQGLRDRERTYEKDPGTRRVLVLGDSITEGIQVTLEQTFPVLLEADLHAAGLPVEIINGGVSGYGTDNALMYFRAEGAQYAADVVLLVFNTFNDVGENSRVLYRKLYTTLAERMLIKDQFRLDEHGTLVRAPAPEPIVEPAAPDSWWMQIEYNFFILRALRRLVTPAPPAAETLGGGPTNLTIYQVANPVLDAEWSEAWQITEALIRTLRAEVEATGARFAVAVVPQREAVTAEAHETLLRFFPVLRSLDPEFPVRKVHAFLQREGIPTLDLLPVLREAALRTGESGFFAWDVHLDEHGHETVARGLAPFVADLVTPR